MSVFDQPLRGLVLAVLAACQPALAGPAPSDPESFLYTPLPTSGNVPFRIDVSSPRFEFRSGISPYAAFHLPEAAGTYLIDVISFLDPPADPSRSRVFYPSVALLSESFLLVRASDGVAWRFDLPELGQTTAPAYRVTVAVEKGGPERYLIVYTQHDEATRRLPGAAETGNLMLKVTRQPDE